MSYYSIRLCLDLHWVCIEKLDYSQEIDSPLKENTAIQ